jgi:hypothetical protein
MGSKNISYFLIIRLVTTQNPSMTIHTAGACHMKNLQKMLRFIVLFMGVTIFPVFSSVIPKWEIGDWWVVESQYWADLTGIIVGVKPYWTPIQTLKFQIDAVDSIDKEKYFVLSIRDTKDTSIGKNSEVYRFWLRTSDLFVRRFEINYPPTDKLVYVDKVPLSIRHDYLPNEHQSFNIDQFPALPLTIPLFNGSDMIDPIKQRKLNNIIDPKEYSPHEDFIQEVKLIQKNDILSVVHAKLKNQLAQKTQQECKLVLFRDNPFYTKKKEKQYWTSGMPWAIYGEAMNDTIVEKKYWLVETGKAKK